MPDGVNGVAFGMLAAASVLGAVMMLTTRNVMRAAFWLLEVMAAVAGVFLVLSAEFLALVQLAVYAGAVSILVLFSVMLTLRTREECMRSRDFSAVAAASALAFGGLTLLTLGRSSLPASSEAPATSVEALGRVLFTSWLVPFEIASLVLLVALVGAVWWAGGDRG